MITRDLLKYDTSRNFDVFFFPMSSYIYIIDMYKLHYGRKRFDSRVWCEEFVAGNNNFKENL